MYANPCSMTIIDKYYKQRKMCHTEIKWMEKVDGKLIKDC